MNILPKKNWHVRKKENIARVRRDEAEAAEKEKEIERRAKLAEQEARVALLRHRAREQRGNDAPGHEDLLPNADLSENKIQADIFTSTGNINFFKDLEEGGPKIGTNKEYEEEKKLEKETYEKKIGLLTYLGQDTLEATGKTAWFTHNDHVVIKMNPDEKDKEEIGLKSKVKIDPLNEIMRHTNTKVYPKVQPPNIPLKPLSADRIGKVKSKNLCRKDKKHKKERKCKKKRKRESDSETDSKRKKKSHKKKKRRKEIRESSSEDEVEKQKRLAKLREERLAREARERKREERLLLGKDPDAVELPPKPVLPYTQKYNSQFNPQLAKQNHEPVAPSGLQPGVKYWLS